MAAPGRRPCSVAPEIVVGEAIDPAMAEPAVRRVMRLPPWMIDRQNRAVPALVQRARVLLAFEMAIHEVRPRALDLLDLIPASGGVGRVHVGVEDHAAAPAARAVVAPAVLLDDAIEVLSEGVQRLAALNRLGDGVVEVGNQLVSHRAGDGEACRVLLLPEIGPGRGRDVGFRLEEVDRLGRVGRKRQNFSVQMRHDAAAPSLKRCAAELKHWECSPGRSDLPARGPSASTRRGFSPQGPASA